jgi:TetR/AcrR family transcriptional regulator, cholesterol catabolism regulator
MTARDERKRQTGQTIINTALLLFSRQGYRGTTVRQIARETGIQAGSLYVYVKSKAKLLLEVQKAFVGDVISEIEKSPTDLSAREKLERAFEAIMVTIARNRLAWKVIVDEINYFPRPLAKTLRAYGQKVEDSVKEILEEGKGTGEFEDFDTQMAANFLLGACHHSSKWIDPKGRYSPESIGKQFASFFIRGICKRKKTRKCSSSMQ